MILLPALGVGDPQECKGDIAILPSFGPPFFLLPFMFGCSCLGCMWCLEGEECAARKFNDRDESRWVLQKWEEEVEVVPNASEREDKIRNSLQVGGMAV